MDDTTKTARALPTAEEVRALLDYDPETGVFTWRRRPQPRGPKVGTVAGCVSSNGYWQVRVLGRYYRAHRLAWLYVHGRWPPADLDHRDGDRLNNAIANLREVSRSENMQNQAKQGRRTSSRYLGVAWHKQVGRWVAYIKLNRKRRHLGCFDTQEEAYAAYLAAKAQLHPAQPVPRANAYARL